MKLTKLQEKILQAICNELDIDGLYDEQFDSINAYVLVALEIINDYDGLEDDIKNYVSKINNASR